MKRERVNEEIVCTKRLKPNLKNTVEIPKNVKIQVYFDKLDKQSLKLNKQLQQNNVKINELQENLKYGELTFLDEFAELSNKFRIKINNNKLRRGYEQYSNIYRSNIKKSILPRMKRDIINLEISNKEIEKKIKQLDIKIKKMKKKYEYKECQICFNYFKSFKKHCHCTNDNLCLSCIKNIFISNLKDNNSKTVYACNKYLKCPFCKGVMKKFVCPFCPSNKQNRNCLWCKQNNELKKIGGENLKELITA